MLLFEKLLWLDTVACGARIYTEAAHLKLDFQKKTTVASHLARRAGHLEVPLPEEQNGLFYGVNVSIGTPPQHVLLQVDTGSSNVWTLSAASKQCQNGNCDSVGSFNNSQSSTFQELSQDFSVSYGTGAATGDYFSDVFNIGGVQIKNLTMGLALNTQGGTTVPILGIGLDSLQRKAQMGAGPEVPGVLDGLASSGAISRRAFSLYLDDQEAELGSILFGGIDSSKYQGELVSLQVARNSTGQYDRYRVDLTSVSFDDATGNVTVLSPSNMSAPSALDSGASQLILPAQLTLTIVQGIGAIEFQGIYLSDCSYRNSNATFTFQFGGSTGPSISVPLNQLLSLPVGVKFADGAEACQLNLGLASESEIQFFGLGGYTLGDPLIRNAYLVYDADNLEIAMAQAVYNKTSSGTIIDIPSGSGLPGVSTTITALPTLVPTSIPASLTMSNNASTSGSASATATGTLASISVTPSSPMFNLGSPTAAAPTSTSSSGASSSLRCFSRTLTFVFSLVPCVSIVLGWF